MKPVTRPDLGLPPGSPVYIGDRSPAEMALSVIGYDPAGAWTRSADTVEELLKYRNPAGITWINVNGLKDTEAVSRLAEAYHIHPLTVEDILNTEHRPKAEEFDDYLFITLKEISCRTDIPEFDQISLICTGDTVITFQETAGDNFDGIRRRILNNLGRIRRLGTDFLSYILLDAVVDSYFLALDILGGKIENFEERALDEKDISFIADVQQFKGDLFHVRRAIWPLRESLSLLTRLDSSLITREMEPFLKDLQGNVIQATETVESYRELITGIMEVNFSSVSNSMNNVMKVLTIISTIFIPLTFIAGVYGMNFAYMPELGQRYGYPVVMIIMFLIALGMIVFFKRRHWM